MNTLFLLTVKALLLTSSFAQIFDNSLAPPVKVNRLSPTAYKPKCKVIGKALDLLFVLDASGSLRADDKFDEELDVIRTIVNEVALGPDATRVGLVQYSGTARTEFHFNTFDQRQDVLDALTTLRPMYGVTKTGNALFHAVTEFKSEFGMRDTSVPKVLFLLSDGRTSDSPRDEQGALAIRNLGLNINIHAYGTGVYVAIEELHNITNSKTHVYTRDSLNQMKLIFQEFAGQEICEQVPVCVPGADKPVDLLLIIDRSTSISNNYDIQIDFLGSYIMPLINVHPDAVRVALIQYAASPTVMFDFNDLHTTDEVNNTIRSLKGTRAQGSTRTNLALDAGVELLLSENPASGHRNSSIEKLVVVLTDGHSQLSVRSASLRLAEVPHVDVFAIGLTDGADLSELSIISGHKPNRVFTNNNKDAFLAEFQKHVSLDCPDIPGFQKVNRSMTDSIIQGPADATCGPNAASFVIRFRRNFVGRVYAVDRFRESSCGVSMGLDSTATSVSLTLLAGTCGMKQHYVDYPTRGIAYNVTLVIQFHPNVITVVDQSIDLGCVYPTSSNLQQLSELKYADAKMRDAASECTYTLRRYASDGCVALDAKVGDPVFHRWECDNNQKFRFLVHDCFIESSGGNESLKVLDENGCGVDSNVFKTPTYTDAHDVVLATEQSVRFPGTGSLKYRCLLSFCDDDAGQCDGIVPPVCDERKRVRRAPSIERLGSFVGGNSPRVYLNTVSVETRMINIINTDRIKPTVPVQYCGGVFRV